MRIPVFSGLLLGLLVFSCGGEDKGPRVMPVNIGVDGQPLPPYCRPILPVSDSPDPGSGPVDCKALDGYELLMIDDFEGASSTGWYVNNDRTAEQVPAPDEDPPRTSAIPNGRCVGATPTSDAPTVCDSPAAPRGSCTQVARLESRSAIHVRSGLLTNNGGQLGRDLPKVGCSGEACMKLDAPPDADPDDPRYWLVPGPPEVGPCSFGNGPSLATRGCRGKEDYSDWDGLVLWVRAAPGSAAYARVRVGDGSTDDKGCACDPYTSQNDSSTGCDKWGTYLSFDPTFRAYLVPFSSMQQGGWGMKAKFLDKSNLFSLGIEWGRGAWDLWIDDVAFYRSRK